jgi:hypothetical protein
MLTNFLLTDILQVGGCKSEVSRGLSAVNAGLCVWTANACAGNSDTVVMGPIRAVLGAHHKPGADLNFGQASPVALKSAA